MGSKRLYISSWIVAGIAVLTAIVIVQPNVLLDRERIVKKNRDLHGDDVRLFQLTPAWDLAKSIEDEDTTLISRIVDSIPQLLAIRDSLYGKTPLMLAMSMQKYSAFALLLRYERNIENRDLFYGATLLSLACHDSDIPLRFIADLIARGANVNCHDSTRTSGKFPTENTKLKLATRNNREDIVQLLLDCGANVNDTAIGGRTALVDAVVQSNYDIAILLIEHSADYHRPMLYEFETGKPRSLLSLLREDYAFSLNSKQHMDKQRFVAYLKTKGLDYSQEPIPEVIRRNVYRDDPANAEEFLRRY